MPHNKTPNKLINEKSPYLLQHAHNPVDWYPWGEDAFSKAKAKDKPIFLSIGYSTCHWCHVMERESFEDQDVAKILNQHFIAIKVDREERPDIDHIYMTVCQTMTGQGGWPLTIIMTPDKKPFFAGTYFPKTGRGRMPGLLELLPNINELWLHSKEKVLESSQQISRTLEAKISHNQSEDDLDESVIHDTYYTLAENYDSTYGGFGGAPKFPTPQNLYFLLRYWKVYHEKNALMMVEETLTQMFKGGIYDHLGFGFSRYSTDEKWLVPHFEKMLYDNALLAIAYLETYQETKKELYREVAEEILTYIQREMTDPEGGFYSAEDADSEGVEGKFYLWVPEQIKKILGKEEGNNFCNFYDISVKGNFETFSIPNLIQQNNLSSRKNFTVQRDKLFTQREERIHPFKDDKILTSWNGLMIAAFSIAARVLNDPRWAKTATHAADFILKNLRKENGRLLARYRKGEAAHLGYLDDYAFLTWGLIELYQANFQAKYLLEALNLSNGLITHFQDEGKGGFFLYGDDGEQLIIRPKEIYDGATPSGNSVTALNFLRLARLTGQQEWEDKASKIFQTFAPVVKQYPPGYCFLLIAHLFSISTSHEIILVGPGGLQGLEAIAGAINNKFSPHSVVVVADPELEKAAPFLKDYAPINEMPTAYVCHNFSCQAPTNDLNELIKHLES